MADTLSLGRWSHDSSGLLAGPVVGVQPQPGTLSFSCSKSGLSQGSSTVNCAILQLTTGLPGGASGKEPTSQCRRHRRHGFDLWVGRSPGGGHGNLCQYSCLENPMDRGAWWVAKSQILSMHSYNQSHKGGALIHIVSL